MKKTYQRELRKGGMLTRLLPVLLILTCVFVMILKYHHSFLSFFSALMHSWFSPDWMCGIVSFVFLTGCYMELRSIIRMHQEANHYKGWEAGIIDTMGVRRALEEMVKNENRKEYMFCKRLSLILDSTHSGEKKNEKERVLPHLTALHDISLRAELSRWEASGAITIVSLLLILGIFGTLSGVHKVLKAEYGIQQGLADLAPALGPSAIAVFGTIVLIILHAYYRKLVDTHVASLDMYTLKLLSKLAPKEEAPDYDELKKLIEALPKSELLVSDSKLGGRDYSVMKKSLNTINREELVSMSKSVIKAKQTTVPSTAVAPISRTLLAPLESPIAQKLATNAELIDTLKQKVVSENGAK